MRPVLREKGISDDIMYKNNHRTTVQRCNYAYRDNGCALRGSAEFVRSTLTRRVLLEDGMWMRPVIRKTGISDVIMYKELSQYHSPTMKLRISRQWLRLAWIC